MHSDQNSQVKPAEKPAAEMQQVENPSTANPGAAMKREIGGRKGLEPTRYGDWEKNGRCIDF
jgi:hypothetical protein